MDSLPFDTIDQIHLLSAIVRVEKLRTQMAMLPDISQKVSWITPQVQYAFDTHEEIRKFALHASNEQLYVLGITVLLDQFERLFHGINTIENSAQAIEKLVSLLVETEEFYAHIGGILGYYETVLRLLLPEHEMNVPKLSPPPTQDMRWKTEEVWSICYEGIRRLGEMAEIYTVGGTGDRLRLIDEKTKEPMPVASLQFCGRSLLEWLFRDLQAREYWYFRSFGKIVSVPVLLMTSKEKNNDRFIMQMSSPHNWYGKDSSIVRHIVQALVPLVTSDGQWACNGPLELMTKPGGHGVIWKLAHDKGAFSWLHENGIVSVIVRQINNPLAGLDHAISSLLGRGLLENKAFGFAGIERIPGLAEGLLVMMTSIHGKTADCTISNIEYTKFADLAKGHANLLEDSTCPANTNILFANIRSIEQAIQKNPIPGIVVNAKTHVDVMEGSVCTKRSAARLESTMQNIADSFCDTVSLSNANQSLSTFVNLYERSSFFSVTKKAFHSAQDILETPESCFYDWYNVGIKILQHYCRFNVPEKLSLDCFLQNGPNCIFFFHPALGPFWEVIAQKVSLGKIVEGSELELEIAEIYLRNLHLKGSFRIVADSPTGLCNDRGVCQYSENVGRAYLKNIYIENDGVTPSFIHHLKRAHDRKLGATIKLEGASEVVGENLTIRGPFEITVPHGKRAHLVQAENGEITVSFEEYEKPSWRYDVHWNRGQAPNLTVHRS